MFAQLAKHPSLRKPQFQTKALSHSSKTILNKSTTTPTPTTHPKSSSLFIPYSTFSSITTLSHLTFSTSTTSSSNQNPDSAQKRMADKAERKAFLTKHLKITHEPENSRFVIYPADLNALWPSDESRRTDEPAKLLYRVENGNVDFTSTYCPVPFRAGTGISEFLVENALNWSLEKGYKFKDPHGCWYVQKFMPWPKVTEATNNNSKPASNEIAKL